MVALFVIDTLAYQCGGQAACRSASWFASTSRILPYDKPGVRLAVGAVVAGCVAASFFVLARRTRAHYESEEPPAVVGGDRSPSPLNAAAQVGGLRSAKFWSGALWHQHLSDLHLAAGVAVVAGMLGWCVVQLEQLALMSSSIASTLAAIGSGASVAIIGTVVVVLAFDTARHRLSSTLLLMAAGALLLAIIGALLVPSTGAADGQAAVVQPPGPLPGMATAVNVGVALGLGLLVPLAVQQGAAWARRWRQAMREVPRTTPGRLGAMRACTRSPVAVFPWAAPLVMNTLALILAMTIQLSVIVSVTDLLGDVEYGFGPTPPGGQVDTGASATAGPELWVPPAVGSSAALLSLGLLGVLVLFAVGAFIWWRGTGRRAAPHVEVQLRKEYEDAGIRLDPRPVTRRSREAWLWSAFLPAESTDQVAPVTRPDASPGRPPHRPTPWVEQAARSRVAAVHVHVLAALLVVTVAVLGLLGTAAFIAWVGLWGQPVPMIQVPLGTRVAALLPVVSVVALRAGFRNERWRRALGSLFDVGAFFPRSFHPFAPPSYTERAVPELLRRVWLLHDNKGRVVLTAHSQGSVLAAAVLGRESGRRTDEPLVGLVTLGSPLAKLYRWAFPALVSDEFLQGLGSGSGAGIGALAWRNVYYETDYIGGPVRTGGSVIASGVDQPPLVDPPDHWYVFGQRPPAVLSHTGYWRDERFWHVVNAMCDHVVAQAPPSPPRSAGADDGVAARAPDPTLPVPYL